MKVGDTAYIVESNRYVREVEIRRCSGGMFLVRFTDTGGGIQVKAHRLFATREEAEKSIEKAPETKKVASADHTVRVYLYYEGADDSLYTTNLNTMEGVTANITFSVDPTGF